MTVSWIRVLRLVVPALMAGQAIAADLPPRATGPMTFASAGNGGNCIGCEWTAAEGTITAATPAAFDAYVARNGCPIILIDSPGGDPKAAMALGRRIREHCVEIAVGRTVPFDDPAFRADHPAFRDSAPGRCEGACVLAFLGGRSRTVGAGELVPGALPGALRPQAAAYLAEMGASRKLVQRLTAGPAGPLDGGELASLGLANAGQETKSPWQVEERGRGLVATMSRQTPTNEDGETLALFCRRNDGTPAYLTYSGFDTGTGVPDTVTLRIGTGDTAVERDVSDPELDARDGPDGTEATVALSRSEREAILSGQAFSISAPALPTAAAGGVVGLDGALTEADRAAVRKALANCL